MILVAMVKQKGMSRLKAGRHDPLAVQIEKAEASAEGLLRPPRVDHSTRDDKDEDMEEVVLGRSRAKKAQKEKPSQKDLVVDDKSYVDARMTRKILHQAREQQQEEEVANAPGVADGMDGATAEDLAALGVTSSTIAHEGEGNGEGDTSCAEDTFDYLDDTHISAEDERILAMFRPGPQEDTAKGKTLADFIMEKIHEKEDGIDAASSAVAPVSSVDPKVVHVFRGVGKVLAQHRSGQLPKAFKIIPTLRNWEDILFLTSPEEWTPAAMFAATRLFASNLNERMAQRFYHLVLLPAVEDNIDSYGKLNYHYYQALLKAAFKPAAFYRGIILPLCSTACSLKKAVVFASVVAKTSIPVLHSAVALMKLAEMDYSGVASLFIRVLCDKKYALPHRVLDALVAHFVRTADDPRGTLPVLWHQSLLTFVQRYRRDLTHDDRELLKPVLRAQDHGQITREIRRELFTNPNQTDPMQSGM